MNDFIRSIGLTNIYSTCKDRPHVFVDLCRGGAVRRAHQINVETALVDLKELIGSMVILSTFYVHGLTRYTG